MLSRVIAKNIGDVFFETQCSYFFIVTVTVTMHISVKVTFLD